MYVVLSTRPDISFSVTVLSRYNVQPLKMHLSDTKCTLRYLKKTASFKLCYPKLTSLTIPTLSGYIDSDWAGSTSTRKLIKGCIFFGHKGGPDNGKQRLNQLLLSTR